jgi:hypothetical protein
VDIVKPPVRLPLGSHAVAKLGEKNSFVQAEPNEWLNVAVSADYDDVSA